MEPRGGLFLDMTVAELSAVYVAARAAGYPANSAGVRAWILSKTREPSALQLGRRALDFARNNPEIMRQAVNVGRRFLRS